jgi:hypothetical protein
MSELNNEYDAFTDPLSPVGKNCTICGTDYDDDEWGMMGWLGILPLSLCPTCTTGIFSMVLQHTPVEELEELVAIRRMEEE